MSTSARSSARKSLIAIIAVVAAAVIGWYYWSHRANQTPDFTTTTVGRGNVIQVVTATGTLQSPTSVNVSSQVSGLIQKVDVDFNSPVKKGQILCELDPATYQSRLEQAQAQLAQAKATYDLQKLSTDRTHELREKGLVAQQDLDQADAQLAQAAAQLKIAQSNVDSAKVDLSRCTIYSPIDGIVIDRECDVGNTVAASFNAPTLFTIANDLSKMQIDASVSEADIGSVKDGQDVNFTVDAYPDSNFVGKVIQIRNAPKTESNVVTYDVIISVHNNDLRLKPGMTANVSIVVHRAMDALRIANSALRVRVPAELLPKPAAKPSAPGASGSAAKPMSEQERRRAVFQVLREAGFRPGSGPPSPDVIKKAQELAKARGLDIDFSRFGEGRRGGRAERNSSQGETQVTTHVVYKLVGSGPKARIESVMARLGISDGIYTQILGGLKPGDVLVTGVSMPDSGQSGNNRFGRRGPFGRF